VFIVPIKRVVQKLCLATVLLTAATYVSDVLLCCLLLLQVWLWATALIYLVWRCKWRRDRKAAAEQFEKEQQMQQQLDKDWQQFAQQYKQGVQQERRG
jgi:Flp pilus assembly protein TadB